MFSRLREDNSKYQGTGEPLLHEDICNTLGWLHSLSPTKDRSLAGVRSECSDSVINSPLPWDRGRDLRSLRAGNVFWRTRPWRIGGRWMPEMLLETQGWNHDWWEKTAALQERNAHGRGCTRRAAEEACVREQLQKQAVGRWQTLWEWTLEKRNSEKGKMQRQEGRWNEGCPWKQPGDEAVWGREHLDLVISGCFSCCGIWSGLHHVRRT